MTTREELRCLISELSNSSYELGVEVGRTGKRPGHLESDPIKYGSALLEVHREMAARIAELEAENKRLQRDADSRIVQEAKRQIESRQGDCILISQGTLEPLIEERIEALKAAPALMVETVNLRTISIDAAWEEEGE